MRRNSGLQKLLYAMMVILGTYILYKCGGILAQSTWVQDALDKGKVQQSIEDAAMRTWAPGYTSAVETQKSGGLISAWMRQVVPVFSFLADGDAAAQNENESEAQSESAQNGNGAQPETAAESESAQDMIESEEVLTENSAGAAGEEAISAQSGDKSADSDVSSDKDGSDAGETEPVQEAVPANSNLPQVREIFLELLPQISGYEYLLANYYTVDAGTSVDEAILDANVLLGMDLSLEQDPDVPQILIYHTHSQEAFVDSEEGNADDTVVGIGEVLADELRSYGYNVIHHTGVYDLVEGVLDRSAAYDYARASVTEILKEYPTIEVMIDLHRDGVDGEKFVTEIDGTPASMIMFFNGLSRDENGNALTWLPNEYLTENLAFSLQLEVLAQAQYPGFTRKNYLDAERYNLHLRPRSLLIEAGTQLNTVEEEKNAMAPLAKLIYEVLSQ